MIDGELVSLGHNKPFQTLKHHDLLSVLRLGSGQPVQRSQLLCIWGGVLRACSIITSQFSICDRTRFSPAVASSLTFSLWVDVRNSLLKRPNQHSFAICNKERLGPAFSNILRPVRLGLGEFRICLFQYPRPLYKDGSAGSSLLVYTKF